MVDYLALPDPPGMRVDGVNRWKAQTVAVLRQVGGTGARGGSRVTQLGHGGRSAAILARAVDGGVLWAAQGRGRPPPDAIRGGLLGTFVTLRRSHTPMPLLVMSVVRRSIWVMGAMVPPIDPSGMPCEQPCGTPL